MDATNFWWQADQTYTPLEMTHSLMFTGKTTLTGPVAGSGTISVWIKRGDLDHNQNVAPNIAFTVADTLNGSTAVFRDPSAWMHIVVNDGNTYVNGVRVAGGTAATGGVIGHAFEGYMAELHYVDGQKLEPTEFGFFNPDKVWQARAYTGNHGTHGYYLKFGDAANIGKDSSGNGNNLVPANFSLTDPESVVFSLMLDSPSVNECIFNFNKRYLGTGYGVQLRKNAWRSFSAGSNGMGVASYETVTPLADGKVCWHLHSYSQYIGRNELGLGYFPNIQFTGVSKGRPDTHLALNSGGNFVHGGLRSTPVFSNPVTTKQHGSPGHYYAWFAWDINAGKLWIVGGSSQTFPGWNGDPANGTGAQVTNCFPPADKDMAEYCFQNAAGGSLSTNLFSGWHTWMPAGFSLLSATHGLGPMPITQPSAHHVPLLDSGDKILASAQGKYANGLWIIKDRSAGNQFQLVDSINGTSSVRQCPANTNAAYAAPAGNSVAWCWATPSNGINTTAGFSITNGTHGLGGNPDFVIDRNLNVWHKDIPAGKGLNLSNANAAVAQSWTVDGTHVQGPGGGTYYTWKRIIGYSMFDMYVGNAAADGMYAYCGFRPAFVLIKDISAAGDWNIFDTARDTYNPCRHLLLPNHAAAESVLTKHEIDILSNGFKLRNTQASMNAKKTYIFAAFAEHPFGGSNCAPCPAR